MAKGELVCVTGASGFVASHLVALLLREGYRVRATVRSIKDAKKTAHLRRLPGASERLELVECDLMKEGSFDRAVLQCSGVFHTASPFFFAKGNEDPERTLVRPAVQGTTNVLASCLKAGETLKRVVLTSSVAAVSGATNVEGTIDESQWNTTSTLEKGAYLLSKTLAERAAWDFIEKNKPHWSLVVVNPVMVIGPGLNRFESKEEVNTSSGIILSMIDGSMPQIPSGGLSFVDVRDVALGHLRAYERKEAEGRYLLSESTETYETVADRLKKQFPQHRVVTKKPSRKTPVTVVKNEKSVRELGISYIPLDVSLRDTAQQLIDDGLVKSENGPKSHL
ncbi:hypothetical protein PROFUN_04363 [Planoprotostelium fungivorum]|uniref:NAD-dependent epimerase/dehydratase domain-containing protein n=1 Tax=Planoprotostelium fungivorum TaxID=1890364 RepID=A0A2P6NHS5_9EUKA|nr:hypothetical protein PROFUN_04363 [Planoprotostelium fungivorum]